MAALHTMDRTASLSQHELPTVERTVDYSLEVWAEELRSLFESAQERFADIKWRGIEDSLNDTIWAHKGMLYPLAHKSAAEDFTQQSYMREPLVCHSRCICRRLLSSALKPLDSEAFSEQYLARAPRTFSRSGSRSPIPPSFPVGIDRRELSPRHDVQLQQLGTSDSASYPSGSASRPLTDDPKSNNVGQPDDAAVVHSSIPGDTIGMLRLQLE